MRFIFTLLIFYTSTATANNIYFGYDFGEMAFNDFSHFAGEAGFEFENKIRVNISHMNVAATEEHLSSDFAASVQGSGVEADIKGLELIIIKPFYEGWYAGGSLGHYSTQHRNINTFESLNNSSATLGFKVGYREDAPFGLQYLYWDLGMPIRYTINYYDDTQLGSATVKSNRLENNIWFNVGLNFPL